MDNTIARWLTFSPDTSRESTDKTDTSPPERPENFSEMVTSRTDKTDTSGPPPPSVSFVSGGVGHFLKITSAPPPDFLAESPCPVCGSLERWQWVDGRALCRVCLIAGDARPPVAVKVHSTVLDTNIWVVADDLPREAWPQDGASVYTQAEVKLLLQIGPDTLQWVHWTKELLGAKVEIAHPRRPGQKGNPDVT